MGLVDDIRSEALDKNVNVQGAVAKKIEDLFNSLYYAPKNMDEEVKFVKQMFTRGGISLERVGLHTSAMIVSDNEFCVRQQVLSLLFKQSQKENIPIDLLRIFEAGNAIHEKWQRLFIRGGLCHAEDLDFTRFVDEYELSFTPDAIITINGKKYVVEIKSVNTYQFQKMTSHPSAYKQVNMYMRFSGIKRGIILCEDKNTQKFKVFPVKYNSAVTDPYVERLEAVKYYKERFLSQGIMVKRCEQCNSYLCKRALKCPMRDACYNKGMGRQLINQITL